MKNNPLTKYKITSNVNLIDTYRISFCVNDNGTEPLSPFDYLRNADQKNHSSSYYVQNSLQYIVKQIDPNLLSVDDKNIFKFEDDNKMLMTYINKALEKESYSTFTIPKKEYTMRCGLSEVDACEKLPLLINHNCNVIAGCTRIKPGNTVFINPEIIKHLSYDNVIFPNDIGFIGTINSTISVYSYNEIPKNKIIVSLLNDDAKRNLFQIIDDKIIFMENDENSLGNFFDSVSIIDIVDENIEENNSNEFDTITLKGITYKLVPVEGE